MRAYSDMSEQHAKVLDCLLDCRKPSAPGEDSGAAHSGCSSSSAAQPPSRATDASKSPAAAEEGEGDGDASEDSQAEQGWRDLDR